MENVGELEQNIGELEPIQEIENPKKPRKMRETHSPAQLEMLRRGREKLAEKRAKQKEEKKKEPMNDLLLKFEQRCNDVLNSLEQRVHEAKITPKNHPHEEMSLPPKIQKFFG